MSEERTVPEYLTFKNLADMKRHIQPGTEFVCTSHANHPDLIGQIRQVTEVHSNCFYSVIKDDPDNRFSTANHGKGMRTDLEKASFYQFSGDTIQVLNSRKKDGSLLMEMKVFNPEFDISDDFDINDDEDSAFTMGGM